MLVRVIFRGVVPFVIALSAGLIIANTFQNTFESTAKKDTTLMTSYVPDPFQGNGLAWGCTGKLHGSDDSKDLARSLSNPSGLKIISKPKAEYTEVARQNNIQGTVILRVTFLASGAIGAVSTTKELPDGLTEQAYAAARKIRFQPAVRNGKPISVTKQVEYTFTIY